MAMLHYEDEEARIICPKSISKRAVKSR